MKLKFSSKISPWLASRDTEDYPALGEVIVNASDTELLKLYVSDGKIALSAPAEVVPDPEDEDPIDGSVKPLGRVCFKASELEAPTQDARLKREENVLFPLVGVKPATRCPYEQMFDTVQGAHRKSKPRIVFNFDLDDFIRLADALGSVTGGGKRVTVALPVDKEGNPSTIGALVTLSKSPALGILAVKGGEAHD